MDTFRFNLVPPAQPLMRSKAAFTAVGLLRFTCINLNLDITFLLLPTGVASGLASLSFRVAVTTRRHPVDPPVGVWMF